MDWPDETLVRVDCKIHPKMRGYAANVKTVHFYPFPFKKKVKSYNFKIDDVPSEKKQLILVMKKHPKGYDDKNGNWEYMKFSTDGHTLLRGKASQPQVDKQCAGCHINVADRDYIFGTFYSGAIKH
jgi:hypothetical protein